MSEEIIRENERLKAELKEARHEAAKHRVDKSGRLKEALDQLDAVTKERDKFAKKLETLPTEVQQENERLKGEIRTRDHKSKFAELAKEAKVRPEALDDLWNLSGYKAEKDAVDEDAIREAIKGTVEKRGYLLAEEQGQAAVRPQPGPGGGQGGKAVNPAGSFTMTRAQAADPHFTFENREAIQQASVGGMMMIRG